MNIDQDLYSRQLSLYGFESMKKLSGLKILLIGLRGLGLEIAKNIILSGAKSVTLFDKEYCNLNDMGSNYYITNKDFDKRRDEVCIKKLSELNEYVELLIFKGENLLENLDMFNVIIITEIMDKNYITKIDKLCREKKIGFIYCAVLGLAGFIFTDFGTNHIIKSKLNREKKIYSIKKIIKNSNNKIQIIIDGDDFSIVGQGKYVKFKEIIGLEELNDKFKKIKYISKEAFEIEEENDIDVNQYINGGIVEEFEIEEKISYKSFEESLEIPYAEEILERLDKSKKNNEELLHLTILALHEYYGEYKKLPEINNLKHSKIIIDISEKIFEQLKLKDYEWIKNIESFDTKFIENVSKWSKIQISPVCSFLGGIAAQEVLKYNGKFIPINQWFWFDFFEIIKNQKSEEISRELDNSRYNGQIAIFGKEFQEKLKKLNIFIIGAGAIGCELLKNLSMMGMCCDNKNDNSKVTITDNDSIEISNLNRQFLYNRSDIGQSKSKCACNKIKNFNTDFNCESQELLLNYETEDYFNEDFWNKQDFILNAVDNNDARNYIDNKCCFYSKPYIDSGTLGTIASCFIFYPFKTQCFRDIPQTIEEQIPMCTLKDFPYKFEHCIEFAKSIFSEIFEEYINDLNLLMNDFNKFTKINLSNINSDEAKIDKIEKINFLIDLLSFYQYNEINDLIIMILKIYNKYFVQRINNLINLYPKDYKNSDKSLYWSGNRRFPKIIEFNSSNNICFMFIKSCLIIFLKIFKINFDEKYILNCDFNKFKISANIENINLENTSIEKKINILKEIKDNILKNKKYIPLNPVHYDKDNETDYHLQFVHSFSVLRANNYNIVEYQIYQTKVISGKIIPALSTTTSSIVGFVCLQLCSMIINQDIKQFRCVNINLANNFYDSWFPPKPKLIVDNDKKINGFSRKVLDKPFTVWDSINIKGSLSAKEFIDYFEKKFKVKIYFISCNGQKVIEPIFDKQKDYESIKNKYNSLIEDLYEKSCMKPCGKRKILELKITCKREKSLVLCPSIKYYIGKK